MGLHYEEVRNERQWKATTGLSQSDFTRLCTAFGKAYERLHAISLEQGANNLQQKLALNTYADCLYFVLFQLKTGLTNDCLEVIFTMDGSFAQRNFQHYLLVLELALQQQQAMPRRHFASLEKFKKYLRSEPELITDATEIRTQRPEDQEKRQERCSGEKSHTVKSLLLTNQQRRILYISKLYEG